MGPSNLVEVERAVLPRSAIVVGCYGGGYEFNAPCAVLHRRKGDIAVRQRPAVAPGLDGHGKLSVDVRTWSPTCRPSIWMTSRSSSERSEASQAFIFLRDSATKRRETADFEVPSPRAFARSPSGRRTARWYLRVDTFSTIRLAQASNQPSL